MKKFLTIVSLLTVIATPALAQAVSPGYGTGNDTPFAFSTDGKAHSGFIHNDRQQSGARPFYDVAPSQRQGQRNLEIPGYGPDGGLAQ